jgi:hypothetical protein
MKPGDKLHQILEKLGQKIEEGCPCLAHIEEMNQKGKKWCRDNIKTIVGWLKDESNRRYGGSLPENMISPVVRLAIWQSKD